MDITTKDLVIFDLDGTLSASKASMDQEMADLLVKLLSIKKVAVISGGGYPQFEVQFLSKMSDAAGRFGSLFIMPTSGTKFYIWRGKWTEVYSESFTPTEKETVMSALSDAFRASGYDTKAKTYGPAIEDRGSQITFSALGQSAPLDLKMAWDPDRKKREEIISLLKPKLAAFDVRLGGSTSIDITRRGVNKGYGVRKLEEYLHMAPEKMIFVGDALYHGGDDYPVKAMGIDCIEVKGPDETKKLIEGWVK